MTYEEYFAKDTAPTEYCDCHISITYCNETGTEMLATQNCPEEHLVYKVYMVIKDADKYSDEDETVDNDEFPTEDSEETTDPTEEELSPDEDPETDESQLSDEERIFTSDEKYVLPEDAVTDYCWARPQ
jgi:penicillin-binding protein 1A